MSKQLYTFLPEDLEQLRIGPGSNRYVLRVFGSFDYPELLGSDYIRLLHLEQAFDSSSELRGSLKVHRLDDQCEYEAISYAWGEYPEFDQTIFLDDQVLKISRNLYAALKAYRYSDRTRILWVDAICINQADTADKSRQVAIMADIYSKAKRVQAWLAPASDYTTKAMRFLDELASRAHAFGIGDEVDKPRWIHTFPSVNVSDAEAENLMHDAIEAHVDYLVSRLWFNRVWIVQEVTLAAELTVSCGHSTMDWFAFARALEVLRGALRKTPLGRNRLENIKPAWEVVRQRDTFRLYDRYADRSHHLMANLLWKQMSNRDCADDRDRVYGMLAMTKSPYPMTPDYGKTVAETYTDFTRRYSPIMHIYTAGLCRRQQKTNPTVVKSTKVIKLPDFRASMARWWLCRWWLRGERADSLCKKWLLQCIRWMVTWVSSRSHADNIGGDQQPPIDISDRDYLPSWVPEFRPSLASGWASPFNGSYNTARQAPFYFLPHPLMQNAMGVTGTIFTTVNFTTRLYDEKSSPHCMYDPGFFFSVIDQFQAILHLSFQFAFQPTSESLWLIMAKTLTGGTGDCDGAESLLALYPAFQSLNHLVPGSLPWLTAIWERFSAHCFDPTGEVFQHILLKALGVESRALSTDGEIARGFLNYLANILVWNLLFLTNEGYVGLAPRNIRRGDFVAIFNGCYNPYVVRPAGKVIYEGNPVQGLIQVVGPCYLHGIMNGEIFRERDAPRFSRLKWTRMDGDATDSLEGWMLMI